MFAIFLLLLYILPLQTTKSMGQETEKAPLKYVTEGVFPGKYGVDCSFPIHHNNFVTNFEHLPLATATADANAKPPNPSSLKQLYNQIAGKSPSGSGSTSTSITSSNNNLLDPAYHFPSPHPSNPLSPTQISDYESSISGCQAAYPKQAHTCLLTEQDRIAMNKRQPASMTNYTQRGFAKIDISETEMFKEVKGFWDKYEGTGRVAEQVGGLQHNNNIGFGTTTTD